MNTISKAQRDLSYALLLKNIEEIEDVLNSVGIELYESKTLSGSGSIYRSTDDIIMDLAKVWDKLKDNLNGHDCPLDK